MSKYIGHVSENIQFRLETKTPRLSAKTEKRLVFNADSNSLSVCFVQQLMLNLGKYSMWTYSILDVSELYRHLVESGIQLHPLHIISLYMRSRPMGTKETFAHKGTI